MQFVLNVDSIIQSCWCDGMWFSMSLWVSCNGLKTLRAKSPVINWKPLQHSEVNNISMTVQENQHASTWVFIDAFSLSAITKYYFGVNIGVMVSMIIKLRWKVSALHVMPPWILKAVLQLTWKHFTKYWRNPKTVYDRYWMSSNWATVQVVQPDKGM